MRGVLAAIPGQVGAGEAGLGPQTAPVFDDRSELEDLEKSSSGHAQEPWRGVWGEGVLTGRRFWGSRHSLLASHFSL